MCLLAERGLSGGEKRAKMQSGHRDVSASQTPKPLFPKVLHRGVGVFCGTAEAVLTSPHDLSRFHHGGH